MNIMRYAAEALAAHSTRAAGVTITYLPFGSLRAVIGKSTFQLENADGIFERMESRDYIIAADSLGTRRPTPGQTITDDCSSGVYEIMPLGDEPCWRYCDHLQTMIRIHTKKVG